MVALVGRDGELRELDDAFATAAAGRGGAVVVSGPVGSGKTALLHAFAGRAAAAGARVLRADGGISGRELPFAVADQIFGSLAAAGATPEDAQRISCLRDELVALGEKGTNAGPLLADLLDRLTGELLDRSEPAPLVIVVDDLSEVDSSSMSFLTYLLCQVRTARVLIVASSAGGRRVLNQDEFLRQAQCRSVRLGPLSLTSLSEVFAESPGFLPTAEVVRRGHEITGGSPVLVRALVADYEFGADLTAGEIAAGHHFAAALVSCLNRCGAAARRVAQAVAVLGRDVSEEHLVMMVQLGHSVVQQAVRELTAAGVLDDAQFRHEGARAAVLKDTPADDRAELHGRAAHLLHDEGAPATVIAGHLAAAHRIEQGWGLAILEQAAERALREGDVTLASSCLRLARQVCSDVRDQARVTAALVRAQWLVNPSAARGHLATLLDLLHAGHLDRRDAATVAGFLFWTGRVDEALAAFGRLEPARAEFASVGAWLSCWYPGRRDADGSVAPDTRPLPWTAILSAGPDHGEGTGGLLGLAGFLGGPEAHQPVFNQVMAVFVALVYGDPTGKAVQACEQVRLSVDPKQPSIVHALLRACRAMIAINCGDAGAALEHAQHALGQIPAESWGVALGVPMACALIAATAMGRYDLARRYLNSTVPDAAFETPFGVWYLQARGLFHLATGRPGSALRQFESCGERMVSWRLDVPELAPWRVHAACALLGLDQVGQARVLLDQQFAALGPGHHRVRGMALRVRAGTEPPSERPLLLEKAATLLLRSGDRLELARVFTDLARAYHSIGEHYSARTAAHRSVDFADRCGAVPIREWIMTDFADFRGGTDGHSTGAGFAELSESEQRVAMLASQGYTNRQIAKRLYVTVSTVEQHLTRVYRKLRVRRRSDLLLKLQYGLEVPAPQKMILG